MQMLKKIPSDKTNVTKRALLFLSRAPTHDSFTLILIRAEAQGSSL